MLLLLLLGLGLGGVSLARCRQLRWWHPGPAMPCLIFPAVCCGHFPQLTAMGRSV